MITSSARTWTSDTAPTNGTSGTLAGQASVGDMISIPSAPALYICTASVAATGFTGPGQAPHNTGTPASITWVKVTA